MVILAACLLVAIASVLLTLVTVLCLEIVAAVGFARPQSSMGPERKARGRLAVLVPAYNESIGLLPTLTDIRSQLLQTDQLLVVADNCTDDTAAVAVTLGAEVIERHD